MTHQRLIEIQERELSQVEQSQRSLRRVGAKHVTWQLDHKATQIRQSLAILRAAQWRVGGGA